MLKATEEAKAPIVTVRASDYQWEQFKMFDSNHGDSGLFQAVEGREKFGGPVDKIHLVPLKEGTGRFKSLWCIQGIRIRNIIGNTMCISKKSKAN